jgi:hypothetical protein
LHFGLVPAKFGPYENQIITGCPAGCGLQLCVRRLQKRGSGFRAGHAVHECTGVHERAIAGIFQTFWKSNSSRARQPGLFHAQFDWRTSSVCVFYGGG